MWVEKRRSWLETVVVGGHALPRIWGRTITVTAISIAVTIAYETIPQLHYSIGAAPFTIIGLPLGIFLGFRNNTAYDRFWEGRKLWGGLVNTARSLTRQVLTLIEPPPEAASAFSREMVHLLIAYVHALRHRLRGTDPASTLRAILPEQELARATDEENVPLALLQRIAERLADARRSRWIDGFHVAVLEQSLVSLTDIQGACERIRSTPMPLSYTVLMHRIVAVYCTLLPFGLMDAIGWASPFVVLTISYCFFGLDAIGDELEQPFGDDSNDLPLDSIANTIERNLRRRIGEPLPPPVTPTRGVLS